MLGYRFCLHQIGLSSAWPLRMESRLGSRRGVEREGEQRRVQVYRDLHPLPTEGETAILAHLDFALRHEGVDLAALAAVCAALDPPQVAAWISQHPSGKYARKLGFLYEWLTGRRLPVDPTVIAGAYVPVLDAQACFTGPVTNVARWHVRNNLPGTPAWCPTVHRETLDGVAVGTLEVAGELREAREKISSEILGEVLAQACFAETQASYAIDEETASSAQEEGFERILADAGEVPVPERLRIERLVQLQGVLFSGRPAPVAYGLRREDTFVGSTGRVGLQRVEYPCPPGRAVESLLGGLREAAAERLVAPSIPPVVYAGVMSFGFGFIHPLMEGNGRIHRFLVQAALAERGALEPGTVIPVSAAMLARLGDYGQALGAYSAPVRAAAEALAGVPYILEPGQPFAFPRYERVAPLYRFPVLTDQVAYLERALRQGIETGFLEEAHIVEHLADVRAQLATRLPLSAERLALLIRLIRRDGGTLSRAQRRAHFPELSEEALQAAQAAVGVALPTGPVPLPREELAQEDAGHPAHKR